MRMYFPELINHLVINAAEAIARRGGMSLDDLHEPEITDALVTEFPTMVNNIIAPILGVRMGGCYIHQKPKAHFINKNGIQTSREIGDLLVVCRQTIDGIETFNAAIFQMKMHDSDKSNHHITNTGEFEQLYLYQHWPVFDCYRNKVKTTFDLYPKSPIQGAQYALASRVNSMFPLRIYHSMPASTMSLYADLTWGYFLQDFIINQRGCVITPRADKEKDEWSRLVWYLLDISWQSVYRLKRINRRNQPRIGGDFFNLCNLITHADDAFSDIEHAGNGNNPFFGDNVEEEPEGLSLLLIDAGDDYTLRNPRFKDFSLNMKPLW